MKNQRRFTYFIFLLISLGWMMSNPAFSEEAVEVNSADPNSAEQGTTNLDVTIAGAGFTKGAVVRFLVTGSTDPDDPDDTGGIVVNNVTVRGPKKLIANIDIDGDATIDGFDIEVESLGGRKGIGIFLFSVQEQGTGNPGEGNQELSGEATFTGEISSNVFILQGDFVDSKDFEILEGTLTVTDTLTVSGDAGAELVSLGSTVLPMSATVTCCAVTFDSLSATSWKIRMDRNEDPPDRVQLLIGWLNDDGFQHYLRMGWVVKGFPDPGGYGVLTTGTGGSCGATNEPPCSLRDGLVEFNDGVFRIDAKIPVNRGKKTATMIYSEYGAKDGTVDNTTIITEVFE